MRRRFAEPVGEPEWAAKSFCHGPVPLAGTPEWLPRTLGKQPRDLALLSQSPVRAGQPLDKEGGASKQ